MVFFLLLPLPFIRAEGTTNGIYVLDSGEQRVMIVSNKIQIANPAHDPALITEAKKTRESLPAKDFPEGNWGEVTNGCQLSLRFAKLTYTNGEPIEAVLLLRNVTNHVIQFYNFRSEFSGPIRIRVTTDAGQQIRETNLGGDYLSGGSQPLFPGTQVKYLERVDSVYDLTNGTYTMLAYKPIDSFEVKSAPVTIEIELTSQQLLNSTRQP